MEGTLSWRCQLSPEEKQATTNRIIQVINRCEEVYLVFTQLNWDNDDRYGSGNIAQGDTSTTATSLENVVEDRIKELIKTRRNMSMS